MTEHRVRASARRVWLGSLSVALVALVPVIGPSASASISVDCDASGSLQGAIDTASSGSTLLISGTCYGNFSIVGKSLMLKGDPSATLDGAGAGRTLIVPGTDTLHLKNLTVTGGAQVSEGAGLLSDGPVFLYKVTVTGNQVSSTDTADGGGVSASSLTIVSSKITSNLLQSFIR